MSSFGSKRERMSGALACGGVWRASQRRVSLISESPPASARSASREGARGVPRRSFRAEEQQRRVCARHAACA